MLSENKQQLHIFEGVCDLLSYATLLERDGKNWKDYNLLTLSGVYSSKQYFETKTIHVAIEEYTKNNPNLKTIYLHLDNDLAGINASKALEKMLSNKFEVKNRPPPYGKDVNDYLCKILQINQQKKERTKNLE